MSSICSHCGQPIRFVKGMNWGKWVHDKVYGDDPWTPIQYNHTASPSGPDRDGQTYEDAGYGIRYYTDCAYCQREKERNSTFFPRHQASERCRSGKRNHCTCDTCF